MRYRKLGRSGIEASAVALGAWAMGGWMWGGTDERESVRAVHAALDAGIDFIDTAPVYGFGLSEEIVGRAIADRRDDVVLATKCGLRWDTDKGTLKIRDEHYNLDIHEYLGPESIREECEASLRRLQTDRIDLYQVHWPDTTTPIADTMAELVKLRDEGKIRAIGVSNVSMQQLNEYRAHGQIDTDQEKYSMLDRGMEGEKLPYCRENDIAVIAYSPMAMGLLTGKVGPERQFPDNDVRSRQPRFSQDNRRRVAELLEQIRPLAEAHGISFAQLAVAWAIHQPGVTHALVGARNEKQAKENAAAGDVELSEDELEQINDTLAGRVPQIT